MKGNVADVGHSVACLAIRGGYETPRKCELRMTMSTIRGP